MTLSTSNALTPRSVVELTRRKGRSTFRLLANFAGEISAFPAVACTRGELPFVGELLATHVTSEAGPTSPKRVSLRVSLVNGE